MSGGSSRVPGQSEPAILDLADTLAAHEDADPLELRKLSLSYDYLVYKINDHISTLAETTYQSVLQKQHMIEHDYFHDQLRLHDELAALDALAASSKDLELEFMKLDQLHMFIEQFKERVAELETGFSEV